MKNSYATVTLGFMAFVLFSAVLVFAFVMPYIGK